MCKAIDAANYFLSLMDDEAGDSITNLKMQKLLYYAQGFSLALLNKKLFRDDIVAWMYGPVVPSVYRSFRKYGSNSIPKPGTFSDSMFGEEEKNLLKNVYTEYGQFSAWRLRDMTHSEPPWKETAQGEIISKEKIKAYFDTLVE